MAYPALEILPCLDSAEMAASRRRELDVSPQKAAELGRSAVRAIAQGYYVNGAGERVDWAGLVQAACSGKMSIAPDDTLPPAGVTPERTTRVQIANETTLGASSRLTEGGLRPLALNFANGKHPGGGFRSGSRAQEEVLCRSSALYATLAGDPMYAHHAARPRPDSTDWAIYSPEVPVFRMDDGSELDRPWLLSFLTCAAPVAHRIGCDESAELLGRRISRVLGIASMLNYQTLVLGAWGCGAFGNDPRRTASDFRTALETSYRGVFSDVAFAISDWSPERKFLGPFRDVFEATPQQSAG